MTDTDIHNLESRSPDVAALFELNNRSMIMFVKSQNKKDLVGAEVGVFEGAHAENIFSILSIKKLYLIDTYELYLKHQNIGYLYGRKPRLLAAKRLSQFRDAVVWIYKTASEAASLIPNELDFVYIDANHTYPYISDDIKNYWPKIKKGGVLGGHDYTTTAIESGVNKAVDEFCLKNNLELHTGGWDWWVVK